MHIMGDCIAEWQNEWMSSENLFFNKHLHVWTLFQITKDSDIYYNQSLECGFDEVTTCKGYTKKNQPPFSTTVHGQLWLASHRYG